jgi:hypothetical protein
MPDDLNPAVNRLLDNVKQPSTHSQDNSLPEEWAEAIILGVSLYQFRHMDEYKHKWAIVPSGWQNSEAAEKYGVYKTPREALDAWITRAGKEQT